MTPSAPTEAAPDSSIRVRYETNRTTLNALAQYTVKPWASLILKPGKPYAAGSPQLKPHKHAGNKGCNIQESKIADTWIYTFENPDHPETHVNPAHKLYFFAGGGFRGPPEKEHWLLCAELGMQLAEYQVNLVSYPLAPNSRANDALSHLERLYDHIAKQSVQEGFRITLFGDSSGGNIVLVLGLYAATKYLENTPSGPCPVETVFAMSPAVDLRNGNPDIDKIDPHDAILSRKTITEVAEGWKGDMSLDDPKISPILADVSLYRRAGIKVDGLTAGYDVLSADGILFREKLREAGVQGDWLEWEKQIHCFPLMFSFHIKEAVAGKDWILERLRRNANAGNPYPTSE